MRVLFFFLPKFASRTKTEGGTNEPDVVLCLLVDGRGLGRGGHRLLVLLLLLLLTKKGGLVRREESERRRKRREEKKK